MEGSNIGSLVICNLFSIFLFLFLCLDHDAPTDLVENILDTHPTQPLRASVEETEEISILLVHKFNISVKDRVSESQLYRLLGFKSFPLRIEDHITLSTARYLPSFFSLCPSSPSLPFMPVSSSTSFTQVRICSGLVASLLPHNFHDSGLRIGGRINFQEGNYRSVLLGDDVTGLMLLFLSAVFECVDEFNYCWSRQVYATSA